MKKEMLINVLQPEECRIAILEDGVLEELYVERTSHENYVNNIYKGRIVNIEPSIQAAFVDFGVGRNGFLHVSDVEPAYYRHLEQRRGEGRGERRGNGHDRDRDRDRGRGRDRDRDRGRGHGPGRGEERPRREGAPERRPEPQPSPAEADDLADVNFGRDDLFALPPAEAPLTAEAPELAPEQEMAPAAEPEPRAEPEAEAPPTEEAEPAVEAPAPKSRRSRGSRRRRTGADEPAAEAPAETPAPEGLSPSEGPGPDDRPRLMDSAERRTDEEDDSNEGVAAAPSLEEEDDLFFPRDRPAENGGPPRVEARPEPVAEEEEYTPEPEEEPRRHEARHVEPEGEDDQAAEEIAEEIAEERLDEFDIDELDEEVSPRRHGDRDRGGRDRDRRGGRRGDRDRRGRRPFGRPGAGHKPLIQDIFKRGQEVIVQVMKEGLGTKGPTLSTYISIGSRSLVLMPSLNRIGVSRKIQDDEQRRRLREIVSELKPPKGLGFIIRTAAMEKNKKELQNDLAYLTRLYQVVARRIKKLKAPAELYQESDMITRTIRDTFTSDIDTIWVDEPAAYEQAKEFMQIVMPRYASRIKLYEGPEPLFHKYGIEDEIARIQQRHVPLPHGGSIVIEQTEALVAIDVNSGTFRADNNAEENNYQMNLLAAKEIARQLRLRDLGGEIINDFIDMRDEKHKRAVEKALKDAIKRDRARTKVLRMSAFGIIEMTRQRIRPSLKRSVYQDCAHCRGTGQVKTCESMSIEVMRMIQLAAHKSGVTRINVRVADDVAHYLQNKKRKEIARLEETGTIQVLIQGAAGVPPETLEFVCYDTNNNEVRLLDYDQERPRRR
jgi:ribonuclease E